MSEHLDLILFAVACLCLMAGYPVAFTLAGASLIVGLIGIVLGVFDVGFFSVMPQRIFGIMTNEVLIAVPLFIFMGTMLERARIAETLLENMAYLLARVRGGLGISVTIVGALLAASTGIVGATVTTMGMLSLPTMLRRGYDPALAAGSISAAGTLGQIIPPSIVLVLLGDVLGNAYQQAQLAQGNFAPETVSVGELFAGAVIPGLMLVVAYIVYQGGVALIAPHKAPRHEKGEHAPSYAEVAEALAPPIFLIIAVLGSILGGIATPTEAAAVGAIGTILLAGIHRAASPHLPRLGIAALLALVMLTNFFDLRLARDTENIESVAIVAAFAICLLLAIALIYALRACWKAQVLTSTMRGTMHTTAMVFAILIGAALFSLVFRGLGGDETIERILTQLPGGTIGAIAGVMLVMFVLGFFLDFIEIIFVVIPIVGPILLMMGVSPVWLGVMMAVNLQTSFLTPPFGFALFYLRGVAPPEVSTAAIYRGAIPFVLLQVVILGVIALFPQLATWLPSIIFAQ